MPPGSVDAHAHVVADAGFPMVASRSYTPHPAPEESYLAMLDSVGVSLGVLVQISVYGTDNRYMLQVLRRHPERLRGVAVASEDVTDRELEDMHAAGVRGLRINVLFGGGVDFAAMETLAHRIKAFGWHMQFLMDIRNLPELMPRMRLLPVTGVIDHIGNIAVSGGIDAPGFKALRHLVRNYGYWVKLSGAYRISEQFPNFADTTPFAQSLLKDAPDQMVWGSDWPHVAVARMPNTGALRNLLAEWAPDETLRHKVLVSNPHNLYGFI